MDHPTIEDRLDIELPDHMVVLSFVNDADGVQFRAWWSLEGFKAFEAWVEAREAT